MSGGDTRERLIEAAIKVIAERGEAALRLSEIAAEVGIKQPSIYHFFTGREDLVVAAHRERYLRAVLEAFGTIEQEVGAAKTRAELNVAAERALRHAFSPSRSNARATRISLLSKALTNQSLLDEVNAASLQANRQLAEVLAEAQRKGWMRRDFSPLTIAVWIRAQILGRFVLEINESRYDGDEWNDLAVEAILTTLLTDPAAEN